MKAIPIVCLIIEAPPLEDLGEGQGGDEAQKRPNEGDVHEKSLVVKEAQQGQDADDEDAQDVHSDDPVRRARPADDPVEDEEGAEQADVDELDQERRFEEEKVEEVEQVEEEGIELEEITYKNIAYYKDNENFIYSIINDEPSEIPVGYWKEKTQTIAFYKNK